VTDLFMAGNRVVAAAPGAGPAHLAGRRVAVKATVAGDFFAAGYSVSVGRTVTGDASNAAYKLTLGLLDRNLRAAGAETILKNVGSYLFHPG